MPEDTPNLPFGFFFFAKSKNQLPLSSFHTFPRSKLFLFTQIQTAIWWSSLPSSRHQRRRLLEEEKEE